MDDEWLATRFEENRTRLRAVAYRMLGSSAEAEDAVQETWIRLQRSEADGIANLAGWLTTVTARVCLNLLQSRSSRREAPLETATPDVAGPDHDPEQQAVLADSVGLALLVVLDTLAPAERLAFVLHDMFAMPFDEIAPIVGRAPAATRQLASRARRRVAGAGDAAEPDAPRQRAVVEAFLAASRKGDFAGLLALLDPDVVLRADEAGVRTGGPAEVLGAAAVAETFSGRARAARLATVDGVAGLAWSMGGELRVVFDFVVVRGRVVAIELIADPDTIAALDVVTG